MTIARHRQLNANEKMRCRIEERERCELDIALIRGAAYDKGVARGHSFRLRVWRLQSLLGQ